MKRLRIDFRLTKSVWPHSEQRSASKSEALLTFALENQFNWNSSPLFFSILNSRISILDSFLLLVDRQHFHAFSTHQLSSSATKREAQRRDNAPRRQGTKGAIFKPTGLGTLCVHSEHLLLSKSDSDFGSLFVCSHKQATRSSSGELIGLAWRVRIGAQPQRAQLTAGQRRASSVKTIQLGLSCKRASKVPKGARFFARNELCCCSLLLLLLFNIKYLIFIQFQEIRAGRGTGLIVTCQFWPY